MSKKKLFLKNYLEPIIAEFEDSNKLIDFEESEDLNDIKPYPFTKSQLLAYIVTDEFLSSNNDTIKIEKTETEFSSSDLKKILDNISVEKKEAEIIFEKRRRYQAYKILEYYLSNFTVFDFFSSDSFTIVKSAKLLAKICNQIQVTNEFLFLPFFDSKLEMGRILQQFGFEEIFVENLSKNLELFSKTENVIKNKTTFFLKTNSKQIEPKQIFLTKLFNNLQEQFFNFDQNSMEAIQKQLVFSYETNQIFEKSANNAMTRYKTPIITPEILFITLMEEKNSLISKIIKKEITDETNWYLLRYKLLKRLYNQEVVIKSQVKRNHQFFAYLLKTQLSEFNFEKLIEKKVLNKAVLLFRNLMISDLLKNNFLESFDIETHSSILTSPDRIYSI